MDWVEKMHLFGLYVSLKFNNAGLLNEMFNEAAEVANHYPEAAWLSQVLPQGDISIPGGVCKPSLFNKVHSHISDNCSAAFLINVAPHHPNLAVDSAAQLFHILDFHGALGDYFTLRQSYAACCVQRRSMLNCELPFSHIHV